MNGNNHEREVRDDDLRARFVQLRREEEARAPEFSVPLRGGARQGRRWPVGKLTAVAVCTVTLVAGVLWLRTTLSKPERESGRTAASIAEWRSPTEFLLETPGREMLRTVPVIGEWRDYTRASGPGQKHPPARKRVLP